MQRQGRLKLVAVLVTMAMAAGCAATLLMGLGGITTLGSYKWVEGTMEKDYPRPMQETFNAALEAAKKLNLKDHLRTVCPGGIQDQCGDPGQHQRHGGAGGPAQRDHHGQDPLRHDGQRRLVGLLPPPDHEDPAHPGSTLKERSGRKWSRVIENRWNKKLNPGGNLLYCCNYN